jgi:hypothetical protein
MADLDEANPALRVAHLLPEHPISLDILPDHLQHSAIGKQDQLVSPTRRPAKIDAFVIGIQHIGPPHDRWRTRNRSCRGRRS